MSGYFARGRVEHTQVSFAFDVALFGCSMWNIRLPLQPVLHLQSHCPGPQVGWGRVSLLLGKSYIGKRSVENTEGESNPRLRYVCYIAPPGRTARLYQELRQRRAMHLGELL
jgi:hypothetical protein